MATPPPLPRTRRRRNRKFWFGIGVLALALSLVAYVFIDHALQRKKLARLEQQFRDAGVPLTLEELAATYPPVPEEQNAAGEYRAAIDCVRQKSPGLMEQVLDTLDVLDDQGVEVDERTINKIDELSNVYQPCLKMLVKAANKEQAHFGLNILLGYYVEYPHLAGLRACQRVLVLAAENAAIKEDWRQVAEYSRAQLAVARSIYTEPTAISQLVVAALHGIAIQSLQGLLSRGPLPEETLSSLQRQYREVERDDAIRFAIHSEIPLQYDTMADIYGSFVPQTSKKASDDVLYQMYFWRLWTGTRDRIAYLQSTAYLALNTDAPIHELVAMADEPPSVRLRLLSGLIVPTYPRMVYAFARDLAGIRTAQTAIAIERYRNANGDELPDSLHELVPQFMDAIPQDPFDGQPLRYRQLEDGYVVYSVSHNRVDDGGQDIYKDDEGNIHGDWTFRVTR